ncbi:MAG: hypothetical protein IJD37_01215, partial [Clostridia bacterium]|nr:hypothetical protein [Clostridia bacterium]
RISPSICAMLLMRSYASSCCKVFSVISNTMRLLNLPETVLQLIKDKKLTAGHARALLGLNDNALICTVAEKAVAKSLSVRQVEALVDSLNGKIKKETLTPPSVVEVDYVAELEKRVTEQIGRLFKIHTKGKRKKIEIEYSDERDLENIIKKLCGNTFFED